MKILAIDTSAVVATAAIVDETKTIASCTAHNDKKHAQTIMPIIAQTLALAELSLRDIDVFACTDGPGSFTGLRIGAATVMGLARGCGKNIIPVPTLDALAYNAVLCCQSQSQSLVIPMMDARRGQVYAAFFAYDDDNGFEKQTEDFAADVNVVLTQAQETGKSVICLGDGAHAFREAILAFDFTMAPPHLNMQRAAAVGALALLRQGTAVVPPDFKLRYLRMPQAERELCEREAGGLRP